MERSEREDELDTRKKLKTYIIESNIHDANSQSIKGAFSVQNTEDISLKLLKSLTGEKSYLYFYLDISDERFWKLHSLYDSIVTEQAIKKLVENNYSRLDYAWLPSNLLEKYMELGSNTGFGVKFKNKFLYNEDEYSIKDISMRFWGGGAREVINDLRKNPRLVEGVSLSSIGINYLQEGGFCKESITSLSKFTLMKGDLIDSHFNLVQKIKNDYSEKLSLLESKYRFTLTKDRAGLKFSGSPLYIDFSKPIENLSRFIDILVSSKMPFRISGISQKVDSSYFRVFGVDLHTYDLVNLEITPNWMAIYLNHNTCGNVVTRLVTNLQMYSTSQVKLVGEDNERII
jgi:hypothetical protein